MVMSTPTNSQQPPWSPPATDRPQLRVLNTLTREKVPFLPLEGNVVRWYSCGPTVYDAAHMGHARNYVTFDIIRRILASYFNYDITYVMNITDIDDKIILRARQAHLVDEFCKRQPTVDGAVREEVYAALGAYSEAKLKTALPAAVEEAVAAVNAVSTSADEEGKLTLAKETVLRALNALLTPRPATSAFQDVLAHDLDRRLGHSVTDQAIFRALAAHWEADFLQDMQSLNVLPPDFMTRVSEYIPDIISYVQRIIANGFAYEADGSVYFDVAAFSKGHHYARLCPWSAGNAKFFEEGEGALGVKLTGKRDPRDFALWKQSKPGEPLWESPWGNGRPGWHIECSAMASAIMPGRIDVHSGGIDLAFPHHDNELAQAEAYLDHHDSWVSYFLHAGHVHIAGLKMSKSLKNFISIKDALKKYSARQLRIMFLQHTWSATMSFKDSSMDASIAAEGALVNFFANVAALLRGSSDARVFGNEEQALLATLQGIQSAVHAALCDSFDTPAALSALLEAVSRTNVYLQGARKPCPATVRFVARFVARMMDCFGVQIADAQSLLAAGGSAASGDVDRWSIIGPVVSKFSEFRDSIRLAAIQKCEDLRAVVLTASDQVRNVLGSEFGVVLEDRPGEQPAVVKVMSPEDVARERASAAEREAAALARKAAQLSLQAEKDKLKTAKAQIHPRQMFTSNPAYSKFDERGVPTHDAAGEPLSKSASKKAQKEWEAQEELYAKYNKQ